MKNRTVKGLTGNIAVLEMGPRAGLPLVAVHGWLDNAASFMPLADHLPEYRWLALDLAGHGHSEHRPAGVDYHFIDYATDLCHVVEAMALERFILVGHSLGAGVATFFAAAFPHRVDKLVLIDGLGPISGEADEALQQLRQAMTDRPRATDTAARIYPDWETLIQRRLAAGNISRAGVETLLSRGAEAVADGVRVFSDSRLKQRSPIRISQRRVLAILSGIECPTLLVLAEQGLVHDRKTTPERIAAVPNLAVVTLPGGHHVHLDAPQGVATAIKTFLEPAA